MMTASTVGIRANWTCLECGATATTRQITNPVAAPTAGCVRTPFVLDLPPGWVICGKATLCAEHAPEGRRIA